MDIDDFLNNGVTVKNPNYKKPTKRNPSGSPRLIQSGDYNQAIDRSSRIGSYLSQNSYDLTGLNNEENQYEDHNVRINPVNTEEELNQSRAKNQSAWEQTGRFLTQAVGNEIVLGTALGLSNLVDAAVNVGKESGQNDYTNPFSTYLEGKQEDIRKAFEVYRQNPNDTWQVNDFGWWADNAVSVASTLSMLIPSLAVTKGLSLAGKAARLERVSLGIAKAAKGLGLTEGAFTLAKAINTGAEIGTSALLSRTMENYLEARGVYKETYDKSLGKLEGMTIDEKAKLLQNNPNFTGKSNEEIAQYMSSVSADETFRNDYAMLLFDVAQFKALGSMWKGIANKEVTGGLRLANKAAIANLAEEGADVATKAGFFAKRGQLIKDALKNPLTSLGAIEFSEGLEEGYQGIQTEKGKEVAEKLFDPNYNARTLESYLKDGAIWEQAFWGIVGGVAFQAAGSALGNVSNAVKGKINKANMSEQEYALSQMTDEKIREEEINSRKSRMQDYVSSMQLLNDGKNPFGYKLDPDTKQPIINEGSPVNEDLSQDEVDELKTKLTNEFVTNMVLDATDKGNYDLFREYIKDNNFNRFFEEAGLTTTAGDKNFSNMITTKMDQAYEHYNKALYDIMNSVDVENENVAKIVARSIARRKLTIDDLNQTSDELSGKIYSDTDNAYYAAYEERETIKYVEKALNEIADQEVELQKAVDNKQLSPQAAEQISKDHNLRRNQLLAFGSTGNMFGNPEVVTQFLSQNIEDTDANAFIDEFNKYLETIDFNNDDNINVPKKSIQDVIKKKIELDDSISYLEHTLPTTQYNYQNEYNDVARNVDRLTIDRYNKAVDDVNQYIESQDNLQEARDNIMTNNVSPQLKEKLDILKLGHHSTQQYAAQINALLKTVRQDREKAAEDAKNVTVDNTTTNDQQAANERNDVENVVDVADTREEVVETVPSTGEEQQSTEVTIPELTGDINIDGQFGATDPSRRNPAPTFDAEEEVSSLEKDADAIERRRAEEFILDVDSRAVGLASSVTFNLFKTSRNLFDNLVGKDVNSKEFNDVVDIVADELLLQGVSRGYTRSASVEGIKLAFNMIQRRLTTKGDSSANTFKTLADQLATKQYVEPVIEKVNTNNKNSVIDNLTTVGYKVQDGNNFIGTVVNDSFGRFIVEYPSGNDSTIAYTKDTINNIKWIVDLLSNDSTRSNSTTRLIPDTEFNQVVDQFINSYIDNKGIYTVKGTKTVINIEDLFREILNNNEISFEQAKQIFYNIADYIAASNNKNYIFTNKTELNKNLKTPSTFFNNLVNSKSTTENIDSYMHIAAPSKLADGYNKALTDAKNGSPITISYFENNGFTSPNSISIKSGNVEIGYLGSVTPNSTNTGYSLKKQDRGFVYSLDNTNGSIQSNLDKLFVPLINREGEQYAQLMDIAYKQFAYESANKNNTTSDPITEEEVNKVVFNPVIKQLLGSGEIKYPTWTVTNRQKAQYILNAINNIVFYDINAVTIPSIIESYNYWKASTYNNYANTHKIQQALENDKKITTKLVNISSGKVLLDSVNHDINTRGFTYQQNPIMIVDANGNIINENNNTTYSNVAGFESGSMGLLVADNPNAPIIAMFTESNKLSSNEKLYNDVYNELGTLFNDFQTRTISFDRLGSRLADLFSGPGVKSNNLFSGYSVIRTSDRIALNIQGQKGQYNVIVHKFEKGTNKEGLGITYIPNGNISESRSSISPGKRFTNAIAKEIVNNLSFNKTFYSVNNKNVDNDKQNQYIYKENGKLIVDINGNKNSYDSFGHFALANNAFKTNQGVNANGGYFDNTDKVKSLYINTDIITSPVEGTDQIALDQSASDMIKSASKTVGVNTSELLTKAGVTNDKVEVLTGTNQFNIELIPAESYYDKTATKAEAYYSKGKMYFTTKGANAIAKSPNNLIRLLIHENLHAKFEEQGLFQRDAIADDLLDTYGAMITAINSDTTSPEAKVIRDWITTNKFTPTEYFTTLSAEQQRVWSNKDEIDRQLKFAEEWLVESITQPAIIRYLNNTPYNGDVISVDGIDDSAKTIWQKIIDILLKLFNRNSGNIKNNSILAQQYSILGANTDAVINTESNVNTETETNTNETTNGETPIVVNTPNEDLGNLQLDNSVDTSVDQIDEQSDVDDLDFAVTNLIETPDDVIVQAYNEANDVNMNGVQVVTDMNKYVDQFAEQDKPLIAKMIAQNELKFRCQ